MPSAQTLLFQKKKENNLTFAELAKLLERDEVAVAAIFYGQAKASEEDIRRLAKTLDLDEDVLQAKLSVCPERGSCFEMPRTSLPHSHAVPVFNGSE